MPQSIGEEPESHSASMESATLFWGLTFGFIAAACAIAPYDLVLSRSLSTDGVPGDLRRVLGLSEFFAHGFGVAMILIAIAVLVPSLRRAVPRVAACAFLPGLTANLVKLSVGRLRPGAFTTWSLEQVPEPSIWQSWLGPFPGWTSEWSHGFGHAIQAFPSGHTATAVGLAVGLTWLFPHGRTLFIFMAVMASLQRIVFQAHWPSDVFAGAAIGWLFARGILCRTASVDRWFARWESDVRRVTG